MIDCSYLCFLEGALYSGSEPRPVVVSEDPDRQARVAVVLFEIRDQPLEEAGFETECQCFKDKG